MGIHGIHRPREWDTVTLVEADLHDHADVDLVVLGDGALLLDGGREGAESLARAVDLTPPYRAHAVHRGARTWAVGARSIDVLELPGAAGSEIEVVWDGDERSTRVDGAPTFGSVPELVAYAAGRHRTWVARARRLEGVLWEVEVTPL